MCICFAEYRILPEWREHFLAYTKDLLQQGNNVYLYEGTDQENLFVEVWQADSCEQAEEIKKERCSERSLWYPISNWIAGGPAKMHVWTFKPAHSRVGSPD
ncbi:hypothetical protein [Candidatus Pristimantibacillus sp. PTI5]|uniref:hypothetical protein n=1 Tax=Candidatus Pristimantibacillus sp. PTI5 TaxID=3400422 RepID=UPI003B02D022